MTRQAVALVIFLAACGGPDDTTIDQPGTPLKPAVTAPVQQAVYAATNAEGAGLLVVMDRCIAVEHRALMR